MTLPRAIEDREYQKFEEVNGSPHVKVTGSGFSGSFSQSGLTVGGKYTEVTVTDAAWAALPATPLAGRNAIGIQNYSGSEIKINYDYTAALPAGYVGMVIPNGNEKYYGIRDTILIYAKAEAGAGSVTIGIEELA